MRYIRCANVNVVGTNARAVGKTNVRTNAREVTKTNVGTGVPDGQQKGLCLYQGLGVRNHVVAFCEHSW